MEKLTGSKFCNWILFLSKHSIRGDEWTWGRNKSSTKLKGKPSPGSGGPWPAWGRGSPRSLRSLGKPLLTIPEYMLNSGQKAKWVHVCVCARAHARVCVLIRPDKMVKRNWHFLRLSNQGRFPSLEKEPSRAIPLCEAVTISLLKQKGPWNVRAR